MFLKLRVLFTILAAVCLALILPILTWFGWIGFGACGFAALLFFGLMLLCKQLQEAKEPQSSTTETPDDKTEE